MTTLSTAIAPVSHSITSSAPQMLELNEPYIVLDSLGRLLLRSYKISFLFVFVRRVTSLEMKAEMKDWRWRSKLSLQILRSSTACLMHGLQLVEHVQTEQSRPPNSKQLVLNSKLRNGGLLSY